VPAPLVQIANLLDSFWDNGSAPTEHPGRLPAPRIDAPALGCGAALCPGPNVRPEHGYYVEVLIPAEQRCTPIR